MARPRTLFGGLTPGSERNLADTLRGERTGGILLIVGAVLGLILANGPTRTWFEDLSHTYLAVGPVDLSVSHWASEGLLTIFFFVVGLELTREIQVGELHKFSTAVVPMVGAVGGMVAPALIYVIVNSVAATGDTSGWAIPTATDIAFAVAVLGLVAPNLPTAVRSFLLTLAVVDDLLAVLVIAVAYSTGVQWGYLALAAGSVALFAVLVRSRLVKHKWSPLVLIPIAVLAWYGMLEAGVHATLAGVALGLVVPAKSRNAEGEIVSDPDGHDSLAEVYEHRWRPISAGVAVPIFAMFTAGVVIETQVLGDTLRDPVAWGVLLGLVLGKPIGITLATWWLTRFTGANLAPGVRWRDIGAVSFLAGIGFTMSLLIASLAFGDSERDSIVVIAVLVASVFAAIFGAIALRLTAAGRRPANQTPR